MPVVSVTRRCFGSDWFQILWEHHLVQISMTCLVIGMLQENLQMLQIMLDFFFECKPKATTRCWMPMPKLQTGHKQKRLHCFRHSLCQDVIKHSWYPMLVNETLKLTMQSDQIWHHWLLTLDPTGSGRDDQGLHHVLPAIYSDVFQGEVLSDDAAEFPSYIQNWSVLRSNVKVGKPIFIQIQHDVETSQRMT